MAKIEILPDGTEVKSEHIVHYTEHFPPDTAAAFIWLKNRQPHRWRDKKEVHESSERQERVTVELSPRAKRHIEELRELLFGERPSAEQPQAHAAGPGNGREIQ